MKILILDVYPEKNYRISKDQNGAYGTANNYGSGLISFVLKQMVKKLIDFPPLYCVQVCGELMNSKHEVEYSKHIDFKKNYDLYIIPSSIVCHETEIAQINKLINNNKLVFVIGPFATSNPEPYLNTGARVIQGEPEMFFYNFNKSIEEIKNLPKLISNFKIVDINDLSTPGWEIIFHYYKPKMKFLGNGPAINIMASRGCPYSCFYYCCYPLQQGRKLRLRKADKVVEEMIYFYKKLDVKNFIFRDPVFSINKKHTIEICKKIINCGHKFNIGIETHLKNIDKELADLLAKAGVKLLYAGIETINEDVRVESHRASEENQEQLNKINYLEKKGIKVKAMYILGMPSDTIESYKRTVGFAKKINSSYAQFSVFTPYPGTPAFKDYKDKITVKKYEEFTQWRLVFKHENFTQNDVIKLLDYSFREYYLNPKWIFNFFKKKLFI